MLIVDNNQVTETIYQSSTSIVYRAKNVPNRQPVILKLLNVTRPSPEQLEQFNREYSLQSSIPATGVVKPYKLGKYNDSLLIAMEDFYGEPLSHSLAAYTLKLGWFLETAIQITEIVRQIHQQNIVHRDLSPDNILYNSITGQIKIIDFSLAEIINSDIQTTLEGSLPYIAPEQTGRINQGIDFRTDLYTLGATLYHLLTGTQPFQTSDPMEIIHFHLAKEPTPAHKINASIPSVISQILSKLMEKIPENRYQSCEGLLADLRQCHKLLQAASPLLPFELGQSDATKNFRYPNNIFGRKAETLEVKSLFLANASSQVLTVSGEKGVGKTAFIESLEPLVTENGDYFVSGRFSRENKFGAIIRCLQEYVRKVFTEDQTRIAEWRAQLLLALGDEAGVVTDVLPEIETLLGQQPPLSVLSPPENTKRFIRVLCSFILTSAPKDSFLYFFLDDIDMATKPAMDLLQLLIDNDHENIRFIFTGLIDKTTTEPFNDLIISDSREMLGIELKPLLLADIQELAAEAIGTPLQEAEPLARLLLKKTAGVPLYIRQFFLNLHHQGQFKTQDENGIWTYNLADIQSVQITDNVLESVLHSLATLPAELKEILQAASCISGHFSVPTIDRLVGKSSDHFLDDAVEAGILEKSSNLPQQNRANFSFSHPEIKRALYKTLSRDHQKDIHLKFGRILLQESLSATSSGDKSFEIADQLNSARAGQPSTEEENLELIRVNLQASKRALEKSDFSRELMYLLQARNLLPHTHWTSHPHLSADIYLPLLNSAKKNNKTDLVKTLATEILENTDDRSVKISAYSLLLQAMKTANQLSEAMRIGLDALAFLNIKLPKEPGTFKINLAVAQTRLFMMLRKISSVTKMRQMTNPDMRAAINLLLEISPIIYSTRPELLPFIAQKTVLITLRYGKSREATAAGFALFGLILCTSERGSIRKGVEFGQYALDIQANLTSDTSNYITSFLVYNFLFHWSHHLSESIGPLKQIYHQCQQEELIDVELSAANSLSYRLIVFGDNLQKTANELAKYRQSIDNSGQKTVIYRQMIYQQFVDNLQGKNRGPETFAGSFYNESRLRHQHERENDQTTLFQLHLFKLLQYYLLGLYQEAMEESNLAMSYKRGASGSLLVPLLYFYDSLVHTQLMDRGEDSQHPEFLDRVQKNQNKMKRWAQHAPMNYQHKFLLLEAEICRVKGDKHQALELYDEAIDLAKSSGYLLEEAIGHECLAKYYHEREKEYLAISCLKEARYCYHRWGATAKVQYLDTLNDSALELPENIRGDSSENYGLPKTRLDTMTIIKASRTLTGEIVLEELLKKMLRIMIENAGAQKGFLLFQENGEWLVRAKGSVVLKDTNVRILSGSLDNYTSELSQAVVHYVARTREVAVVNDASTKGLFSHDDYIVKKKPKSLLCAPIIHQGQISCIVYLENNLTTGAFPKERQETLNILGTQAAISLKNSTLYSDLGRTVEQLHSEIEKRKETQNKLLHAEKLTALGRLSASIAHEFGNPLMGIRYLLEDFHNRLKLATEDKELLKIGLEECNRMKNLMNELHQLDKPSSGKMRLFNLHQSIDNVLLFQGKLLTTRNISVKKNFDDGLVNIVAVEDQITQVLINLFMNAADAISPKDGGLITITTKKESDQVILSIHDTGVGIPPENQEHIFEPFFSTKPEVEGTGLGLPTSYGIITNHGGTITCLSNPGEGTTFTITMPVKALVQQADQPLAN